MTEILKRVTKIEGPEIERRRQFNFVRNGALIVGTVVVTIAIVFRRAHVYLSQGVDDPPLD